MSLDVRIKKSFGDYTLDVAFAAGDETLGFLGASGCGKSLTLRCIAGIETPDEGRIVVNGKVFFDSEQKINLTPQQRKTALLFQNYMLFPNLTVADNIGAGIGREVPKAERERIISEELERFGLRGFGQRYPPGHPHVGRALQRSGLPFEGRVGAEPCEPIRRLRGNDSVRQSRHRRVAAVLRPSRRGGCRPHRGDGCRARAGEPSAVGGGAEAVGLQERARGRVRRAARGSRPPVGH